MINSRLSKSAKVLGFVTIILSTALAVAISSRFNPPRSIFFPSKNRNHLLLAVAIDSADGTILVKASDWPHTFFSPFVLGDAIWPENYISSNCHWSTDGTLAVWVVQEVNEKIKRYEAAYDFREHTSIDLQRYAWNKQVCNEVISALIIERGGIHPSAIEIPSLNSGLYDR